MRTRFCRLFLVAAAAFGVTGACFAQGLGWDQYCVAPTTTTTTTLTNFIIQPLYNDIFQATGGVSGSYYAYGGTKTLCFGQGASGATGLYGETLGSGTPASVPGAFTFSYGQYGTVQNSLTEYELLTMGAASLPIGTVITSSNLIDYPAPANPWCFGLVSEDGTRTPVTENIYFQGASGRYSYISGAAGDANVILDTSVQGDAARIEWQLLNNSTTTHKFGLYFGGWMAEMIQAGPPPTGVPYGPVAGVSTPYVEAVGNKNIYVTMANNILPTFEHRYIRASDPAHFPTWVNMMYGQNLPYGLRIENGPYDPNVMDTFVHVGLQQGEQINLNGADEFVLGDQQDLIGSHTGAVADFKDFLWPKGESGGTGTTSDYSGLDDSAYLQKWYEQAVAPGQTRIIVQLFHTTWGGTTSDYRFPYTVTVDAPPFFQPTPGSAQSMQALSPNPAPLRVYVDNCQGYAQSSNPQPIDNVNVTVTFPTASGMTFDASDTPQSASQMFEGVQQQVTYATRLISNVPVKQDAFADFILLPNNLVSGTINYTVTITSGAPAFTKIIKGTMYASVTPRLNLAQGANLVSIPWTFNDSSWTNVLGLGPASFQAYNWDAASGGYVPSTSAVQGAGQWIVTTQPYTGLTLNSSAQMPIADIQEGFANVPGHGNIVLQPGWNLIGNPTNYPIELGTLVGTSSASPNTSFTWDELVSQLLVNGSLATWNSTTGQYDYVEGDLQTLEPQVGYWIFVPSKLAIAIPPVTYPGIVVPTLLQTSTWNQDTNRWRLNLVASSAKGLDGNNFIGKVASSQEVLTYQALKPPMSPVSDVTLSIGQSFKGTMTPAAQAYTANAGAQTWSVSLFSKSGGNVKFTWPNISQVPSALSFRLVDSATGTTRDMRRISGYDFIATPNSTRQLQIQVAQASSAPIVIANVAATRQGRDVSGGYTITYTLGTSATTSVRILSATGVQIYAISQGRADNAGTNQVTWNLRDSANRAVAPGAYFVEVVAETADGTRDRRHIPINVVR